MFTQVKCICSNKAYSLSLKEALSRVALNGQLRNSLLFSVVLGKFHNFYKVIDFNYKK